MKVFIVSALQIYPPISGGQARTGGLAGALVKQGFDVRIFSLLGRKTDYLSRKPSGWNEISPGIREFVFRNPVLGFIGILSFKLGIPPVWAWLLIRFKFASRELANSIAEADAVIADFPYTGSIFYLVPKNKFKIVNTHNVETKLFPNAYIRKMVGWMEQRACSMADVTVCCSDADAQVLGAFSRDVIVIPNGVNENRFSRRDVERSPTRKHLGFADDDRVFLFAASAYGPNSQGLKFLEQFSTLNSDFMVRNRIKFLVVGSVSKSPRSDETLTITGPVDHIDSYFAAADFAINPIFFGSGTSVKLAEFIAARLPVLTTVLGARGFCVQDKHNMVLFDEHNLLDKLAWIIEQAHVLEEMTRSAYIENKHMILIDDAVSPLKETIQRWLSDRVNI